MSGSLRGAIAQSWLASQREERVLGYFPVNAASEAGCILEMYGNVADAIAYAKGLTQTERVKGALAILAQVAGEEAAE